MDFLRNIASAALQSTGVSFPFTIGDRIPGTEGRTIWDIRDGVKKDDSTPLTLFIFDSTLPPLQPGNRDRKALFNIAKNALRKLRSIRHPNVLRYIDSLETETHVYIATERVRPLSSTLADWSTSSIIPHSSHRHQARLEWLAWGLKSLSTGLAFVNAAPLNQHHALLHPENGSVWITPALEWRLGGFEVLTGMDDQQGVLWGAGGLVGKEVGEVSAPEVRKSGWAALRDQDPALSDTYLLALFIFALYNPDSPLPNLSAAPQPSSIGSMPKSLFPLYKRMLNPNARTRLPTTRFVDEVAATGYWQGNNLIELVDSLEGFELAGEADKISLLRRIRESVDTLPPPFLISKILPSLLHSLSLPSAPASHILPLVLSIGKNVPPHRYTATVLDPVVRLYASPDRGTRMALLEGLTEYGDKLEKNVASDKVWPHLITGFADTVAVIREATVKAIPIIAPKLNDRLLNNDLLRLLAKMQVDPEPSIRTNTCILLGRLAPLLGPNTKKKVLVPAFARSLKDTFVHARVAGLMALMATVEFYDKDDIAGRVIPNMAFTMIDKEKLVRDQAFKAMQVFMGKLEAAAAAMPETAMSESAANGPSTTTQASAAQAGGNSLVGTAAGAAGALAGWAISSLNKQLPSSEAHSQMSATPAQVQRPLEVPRQTSEIFNGSNVPSPAISPRPSFGDGSVRQQNVSSGSRPSTMGARFGASPSGGGRMQLGGSAKINQRQQKETSSLADTLAAEYEDEEDSVGDAWGDGDLMDVNADTDDWSAFEAAPTPMEVTRPTTATSVNGSRKTTTTTTASLLRTSTVASPQIEDADGWGDMEPVHETPVPEVKVTRPVAQPKPKPTPKPTGSTIKNVPAAVVTSIAETITPSEPARAQSPAVSIPEKPATPPVNLASMSKEDKEKEMARRREERKAKIAAMKAGKKA